MLLGVLLDDPADILPGLYRIVTMQDLLITDYVYIAGVGATLINCGLIMLISVLIIKLSKDALNGFTLVEIGLMAGFSCLEKISSIFGPLFWAHGYTQNTSGSPSANMPVWHCLPHLFHRW